MDPGAALAILFGAALAVFSIFVVGYSFVRQNRIPKTGRDATDGASRESDDPALEDIFDAIRTLELEFQLGRMPLEEVEAQFRAYRIQAATVLRDRLEAGRGDPAWVLEQEILLAQGSQETVRESAKGKDVSCSDCSAAVPEGAGNCPNCGAETVLQP